MKDSLEVFLLDDDNPPTKIMMLPKLTYKKTVVCFPGDLHHGKWKWLIFPNEMIFRITRHWESRPSRFSVFLGPILFKGQLVRNKEGDAQKVKSCYVGNKLP